MSRGLNVLAFMPSANGQHAGARVAFENLSRLCDRYGTVDAPVCTTETTAQQAPATVHVIRHHAFDLLRYFLRRPGSLGLRAVICASLMHTRLNAEADSWLTDRLEGFDEHYSLYCEDFDLSARAFDAGNAFVHVPGARVIYNAPARQPALVAPPSTACEPSVAGLVEIGNWEVVRSDLRTQRTRRLRMAAKP